MSVFRIEDLTAVPVIGSPVGSLILLTIAVPLPNQLFIARDGTIHICKAINYNRNAKKRWIVEFRSYGKTPEYIKHSVPTAKS